MVITLDVEYWAGAQTDIELPEGKTPADIEDYYVKWNNCVFYFKDGTEYEIELNNPEIDTKRPIEFNIVYE